MQDGTRGKFLELAPKCTVLGYELITQSWDTVSQLEISRRVISYVKTWDSPGFRAKSSKPRSATTGSVGAPRLMYYTLISNCSNNSERVVVRLTS